MKDTAEGDKRGWARPGGAEAYHYFSGPRSLCRAHVKHPPYHADLPDGPEPACRDCLARLVEWALVPVRARLERERGR